METSIQDKRNLLRKEEVSTGTMALPKPPSPLSEREWDVLRSKFAEHEISDEQSERQDRFRAKLEDSE